MVLAIGNIQKHDVPFEEAVSVFYDECAVEFYDDEHSEWEDRFLLLGFSLNLKLLMVCHCYRGDDEMNPVQTHSKIYLVDLSCYSVECCR
jgi:hypothetical protein